MSQKADILYFVNYVNPVSMSLEGIFVTILIVSGLFRYFHDLFKAKTLKNNHTNVSGKVQAVTQSSGQHATTWTSGSANNPGCPAQSAHCREHKRSG